MKTSKLAKKEFEGSRKKELHYNLILKALNKIKQGCSKAIAINSGLDYVQVSRRVSELIQLEKIKIDRQGKSKYYKTDVNIYKLY